MSDRTRRGGGTAPGDDEDAAPAHVEEPLRVAIIRSGGFAGLTRRWDVTAPPADPDRWSALVADCPWEGAGDPPESASRGADRFAWTVDVTCGTVRHRVALDESQAGDGPWRALIDAVRAASDAPR